MSRIGKNPVAIPAGVTVEAKDAVLTVKGPLGTLTQAYDPNITVTVEGGVATLTRANDEKETRAKHGLYRALLNNMVVGVTDGYSKKLEIVGVGYKAEKKGKQLVLSLGYSHPIYFEEENGITFELPDNTTVIVKGIDKQVVGEIAAQIREKRPPEPYLGKGVKYSGEKIRRKAGKTGK